MKFFLGVGVAIFIFAMAMHGAQSSSMGAADLRELIKCVDGIFVEMIKEHKELEKYRPEYKILAKETNAQLDECERNDNPQTKQECIENAIMMFSMLKLSEIIEKISQENQELADLFAKTIGNKCDENN